MSYLPRALLVHDLQTLTPAEWESCFRHVLFPLLARLLEPFSPSDPAVVEETRMRAATVLSKVFLHHLTPLLSLPTFVPLWFNILDYMQKYMHADRSDLLVRYTKYPWLNNKKLSGLCRPMPVFLFCFCRSGRGYVLVGSNCTALITPTLRRLLKFLVPILIEFRVSTDLGNHGNLEKSGKFLFLEKSGKSQGIS